APSRAQQPATVSPALVLTITQHLAPNGAGGPQQEVDVGFGAAYGVQIRLVEDRNTLIFDGFADGTAAVVPRLFPRVCGQAHQYDLYAVANGRVVDRGSVTVVLCLEAAPQPSPTPLARPVATPLTPGAPAAGAAVPTAAP